MHRGGPGRDHERLTVPEAATRLGLSQRAVRARLDRGTLPGGKDTEGRVYVDLPPETTPPTGGDTAGDTGESALLRERAERIASLEAQLAAEREANREQRRLLAAALERMPALGSHEAREDASQGDAGEGERSTPGTAQGGPQRSSRSWWRRWFGR